MKILSKKTIFLIKEKEYLERKERVERFYKKLNDKKRIC